MTKATPITEYKNILEEQLEDPKLRELFSYVVKLEKIAEVTGQYKDIVEDEYCTPGEQEYVLSRLEEAYEEYEMYLDNFEAIN